LGNWSVSPPVLRIAAVGVDAAEDAVVDGVGDLVVERVSSQRRVVGLDVDLELVGQLVTVEKAVHRGAVVVVLMLGGFLRFGLEQERALEPDAALWFATSSRKRSRTCATA
jgi:hypothetical protein